MEQRKDGYDYSLFREGIENLPGVLSKMGFKTLREGQDRVISTILSGRDTICILPTGTGKTACFTIPTLCHNWRTLVFSPLVALMRDQVQSLWEKGIAAGQISGLQTDSENRSIIREWVAGRLAFLYVAPERLRNAQFVEAMQAVKPDMVVLDEAHTLSQWADNFRAAYCEVGTFISEHQPRVVSCFTATCPKSVEADIRRVLGIPGATLEMYYPRRSNLKLTSRQYQGPGELARTISKVEGSVSVYCSTIKNVEELAAHLSQRLGSVTYYHGQLGSAEKRANQDDFMSGRAKVVVATNAFGMGIDKADIRAVIHRDMPGSIEALAQEIGRAGRDGEPSFCLAYYDDKSVSTQRYFVDIGNPPQRMVELIYKTIEECADSTGTVKMTQSLLAKKAGINAQYMGAIMSVLVGQGAVTASRLAGNTAQIRFPDNMDNICEKAKTLHTYAMEGGIVVLNGYYEVDTDWLAERCGVVPTTVRKWLRDLDAKGVLDYVPPYRGSVIQIAKGISQVDFKRLQTKAAADYQKLEAVIGYFSCPDVDKHAYIESFFDVEGR